MTYGTSYFASVAAARRYYSRQWPVPATAADVARKLQAGEIHIGKPPSQPGDLVTLDVSEGRYFIWPKPAA